MYRLMQRLISRLSLKTCWIFQQWEKRLMTGCFLIQG